MLLNNYSQSLKTRKEIAADLKISTKTLSRYVIRFDLKLPSNRMLTPKEYEPIYETLGTFRK